MRLQHLHFVCISILLMAASCQHQSRPATLSDTVIGKVNEHDRANNTPLILANTLDHNDCNSVVQFFKKSVRCFRTENGKYDNCSSELWVPVIQYCLQNGRVEDAIEILSMSARSDATSHVPLELLVTIESRSSSSDSINEGSVIVSRAYLLSRETPGNCATAELGLALCRGWGNQFGVPITAASSDIDSLASRILESPPKYSSQKNFEYGVLYDAGIDGLRNSDMYDCGL